MHWHGPISIVYNKDFSCVQSWIFCPISTFHIIILKCIIYYGNRPLWLDFSYEKTGTRAYFHSNIYTVKMGQFSFSFNVKKAHGPISIVYNTLWGFHSTWTTCHWFYYGSECRIKKIRRPVTGLFAENAINGAWRRPSWNGNFFLITGPLWGKSIGHRWFPLTKDQ